MNKRLNLHIIIFAGASISLAAVAFSVHDRTYLPRDHSYQASAISSDSTISPQTNVANTLSLIAWSTNAITSYSLNRNDTKTPRVDLSFGDSFVTQDKVVAFVRNEPFLADPRMIFDAPLSHAANGPPLV
ncbi:MAG: hypothetical protein KGJ35_02470 [Patescibacteria group bacterium]|nr:hypothetical protein [Patescibacteria group bacterium]